MNENDGIRSHVVSLLRDGQAFETFDEIIVTFGPEQRGLVPNRAEHSAWQELRHIVIAQRDILDFCRNIDGSYVEKAWPDDYWPRESQPPTASAWDGEIAAYHADREALEALIADDRRDLFEAFAWGDGQTLLREALMVAEHTAYHLGQMVMLRRLI